jgi:hypothetical protein
VFKQPVTRIVTQVIENTVRFNDVVDAHHPDMKLERGVHVVDRSKPEQTSSSVVGQATANARDYSTLQQGLNQLSKQARAERNSLSAKYGNSRLGIWCMVIGTLGILIGIASFILRLRMR